MKKYPWSDVTVGSTVAIKNVEWEVTDKDGDTVTLRSSLGTRTGAMPPDREVDVVTLAAAKMTIDQMRKVARDRGFSVPSEPERQEQLEKIEATYRSSAVGKMAKEERNTIRSIAHENGIDEKDVTRELLRVQLGASLLAEGKPGSWTVPAEVMEELSGTRGHLYLHHRVYAEDATDLSKLHDIHAELHEESDDHDHDHIPF